MDNKKVFDCQKMPENIKRTFLDYHENRRNDTYVEHYIYSENEYCTVEEFEKLNIDESTLVWKEIENDEVFYNIKGVDIVSDWLVEHGGNLHEDVLIKYWW